MNFGIIGYGVMGQIRYDVIKETKKHHVLQVFEPADSDCPEDIERVDDYRIILDNPEIDAVFICVPNYLTLKHVTESLDAGKHVFCEKPPGINSDEVLKMMQAEERNPNLKLMFGFNHRQHESVLKAKEVIDSKKYGNLLWMRGRYGKSVNPDFGKNWRSKKELAGGGIFLDQGIHMLDLFLFMCGDFDEVKAFVSNLYWHSDIEDNVFAIFKNKQGQVASLHSTMTQWRHLFSLEMFLEHGYITVNGLLTNSGTYGEERITIAENRTKAPSATWTNEENIVYEINSSWKTEIEIFLNAVKNDTKVPLANTEDALKLMRLVDKVYEQK